MKCWLHSITSGNNAMGLVYSLLYNLLRKSKS